jgi:DNA topoisomerase-1
MPPASLLKRRSWNPADHPRDANGRFIATGDSVALPGGGRGTVVALNDSGKVRVRTTRGDVVRLDPKEVGAGVSRETSLSGLEPATPEQRRRLKIPPAWQDVLVHPDFTNDGPDGPRILAVGRDAKGREQRRYSATHADGQSAAKFERVRELHSRVPELDRLLAQRGGDDSADALLLIRRLGLRPGSTTDTGAEKQAYGASTLRREHVRLEGDAVVLQFTGKKGVPIRLEVDDPDAAAILRDRARSQDDPGARLFPTASDQRLRDVLQEALPGFKVKDLRTLRGTAEAALLVRTLPEPDASDPRAVAAAKLEVARRVAALLGNTPKVALESYVDPTVFGPWDAPLPKAASRGRLAPAEAALLDVIGTSEYVHPDGTPATQPGDPLPPDPTPDDEDNELPAAARKALISRALHGTRR